MKKLLIVDGYNLIYATDRYNKWRDSDLELARVKLIEDLATLKALRGYEVVLVFDAAKTNARGRANTRILGIDVWFTRAGETADSMIERMAAQLTFEGDVIVATSDYSQQKVIFRNGVLRKSSRELVAEFESTARDIEEKTTKRARFQLEERIDGAIRRALEQIVMGDD
ncbi:MAG: NYN domain-containing protein [Actinobacteria bacterium]|nr:NYN domain-containing protein [Actinomycetota bacterium]